MNDFVNLGGGYVIIGQDRDDTGRPVLPPVALDLQNSAFSGFSIS